MMRIVSLSSFALLRSRRPQDALVLRSDRGHSLVDELLNALPFVGFRGVDVALRIGGDAVHAVELTRLPPAGAEAGEDFELLPVDDVDLLVLAVGEVDVPLLGVSGEGDVPDRPASEGLSRDDELVHVLPAQTEDLDAISHAVADVQKPVLGGLSAMDGIPELGRGRGLAVLT